MSNENKSGGETITEEDLTKSLQALEGKPAAAAEEIKPKVVATAALAKSAAEHIADNASEELRKSLDVSAVLGEAVSLLGAHVDNSLEALQKSASAAAQRDLAVLGAFENLMKKVDDLAAKLEEFGKGVATAPKSNATVRVLEKSVQGDQGGKGNEEKPLTRGVVLDVMSNLAKSAQAGSMEAKRWTQATIKFETTGEASNADLLAVKKELSKAG